MKLFIGIILFTYMIIPMDVFAQIGSSDEISVFAETCERIINNESKASARVRASDKASFLAVENIPELSSYKQRLDAHNFNLKIYKLVDNYLEDVKITVTQQTNDEVCVELSAYLKSSSISEIFIEDNIDNDSVINEVIDNTNETENEIALDVERVEKEAQISIPPKPEIVINEDIAYKDNDVDIVIKEEIPHNYREDESGNSNNRILTKIYIDKTEFYNGDVTSGFYSTIEKELMLKPGIKVISTKDDPDYILKTKILKARVDNVNSETGRLQIVVSIDLIDTETDNTITEHQNRFVLFSLSDDNQKEAANLAKKLFTEGISKLLPKIKTQPTQSTKSIITPN